MFFGILIWRTAGTPSSIVFILKTYMWISARKWNLLYPIMQCVERFLEFMIEICKLVSQQELADIAMILWNTWKSWNAKLWEDKVVQTTHVVHHAYETLDARNPKREDIVDSSIYSTHMVHMKMRYFFLNIFIFQLIQVSN